MRGKEWPLCVERSTERRLPVLSRKAIPMTNAQPTILHLHTRRTARWETHAKTVVGVLDASVVEQKSSPQGTTERSQESGEARRAVLYPQWPTSTPGPQATAPPPGQTPLPTRSDQMVYICYDQEQGHPCVSSPSLVKSKKGPAHPKIDLLAVPAEAEALQRWLDDGGTDAPSFQTIDALNAERRHDS